MNCWRSVSLSKEFGDQRVRIISLFISILTFSFLYVPFSLIHGTNTMKESLIPLLFVGLYVLPAVHAWIHVFPCLLINKPIKIKYKSNLIVFPTISYYVKTQISKKTSFFMNLAPTLFITFPGLVASYFFHEYYIFFLIITSVHIGMTFKDFWYISQLIQAPKKAYVVTEQDGLDILLNINDGSY